MINLTLEQMQKQHLDDVARLEQVCFTQPWSYKSLEEELENDTAHLFVALCDDKVAGYISVYVVLESCYVNNIAVFPEYRRKGIASAVTSRLAIEIIKLGKVPFYCAAWSNIRSARNAITSGFRPAWVELTARDTDFVNKLIS